jgi:DNA-binding transcriptional LysR family regulator
VCSAPHRLCAFASPGHLARRGTPGHPEALVRHDGVNFRFQSTGQALRWPFRIGGRIVEITPDAGIVTDFSDAVAEIPAAGGGIGIAPTDIAAPYVARGALVPILREFAVERSVITALWLESRRGNPNVQAFLAFLGEVSPSPAPWDDLPDFNSLGMACRPKRTGRFAPLSVMRGKFQRAPKRARGRLQRCRDRSDLRE